MTAAPPAPAQPVAQPVDDLVERLRGLWPSIKDHVGHEAAARIESLQAEVAALRAGLYAALDERKEAIRVMLESVTHHADRTLRAESALAAAQAAAQADAERWINLCRGYRKMVNAVAPYIDKPLTDDNCVDWLNLNNAGQTIDEALSTIDAARSAKP